MWLEMGYGSEHAKRIIGMSFGRSVKAIEKIVYGNPELVAKVKADLGFPTA